MEKGQLIHGVVTDMSSDGLGIIKANWMVIMTPGLVLGDEADVEIQYQRAGVFYARIKQLRKPSKYRIKPLCPVSESCGGCTFQNVSYEFELEYKKHKVEDALQRIGHIDAPVNDVVGAESPYYYRNKIQVPFGKKNKHVIYGFYKSNTHQIIPIKKCYIEDKAAAPILETICALMDRWHIAPYNEDTRMGIVRHVLIRTSHTKDQVMVVFVTNGSIFPGCNNLVRALVTKHPEVKTVIQNINSRDTNVILGEKEKILYGSGYISDSLLGIEFHISSKSFFQVNPVQCEKLYREAISLADISKEDEVLDAYAGVATIGILCTPNAKHVTSVESVHEAVKNGRDNAKRNNIRNIDILEDDCTEYILKTDKKFDVVIMDPPRKGSTPEFLNALLQNEPKRIVYISCEPSTLARDLEILSTKYEIEKVQPFDMFPRTPHVETVVKLSIKK